MQNKKAKIIFLLILILMMLKTQLFAQVNDRRQEEEKRIALKETEQKILQSQSRLAFDYGGWINYRYDDYNEDDNDSTLQDIYDYTNSLDLRLWVRAVLNAPFDADYENKHSLYVRIKDLYINRRPEDTAGGDDHDGPHLDYAFLTLDFRPIWVVAGRYYFSLGEGIAYSNVHDGVDFFLFKENWKLKTFLSFTQPNEHNIDTSIPGYEKNSQRVFLGSELTYKYSAQQMYGYYLIQRDHSDEQPQDPINEYTYESEYLGLGAKGEVINDLSYRAELIYQTGSSRIYSSNEKSDIKAWAGDFELLYNLEWFSRPKFYAEYAFGSGDSDRVSVTDTQNGNSSGEDNNFLYFGYIDTGYALAPLLSNLHFFKIGFSFSPLEYIRLFKKAEFKLDYLRFYKDKKSGGIYDLDATQAHRDIGDEIDVTFTWQVFSDLNVTVQYGHFMPGKAYADSANDSEDYFSLSTHITF
jgi:hypothetical protein